MQRSLRILNMLQTQGTAIRCPARTMKQRYSALQCSQILRRHVAVARGRALFRVPGKEIYGLSRRSLVTAAVQTRTSLVSEPDATVTRREYGSEDLLVMDVTKMMCGGCSASVKKILLQHPHVEDASVNLVTGTAVVNLRTGCTDSDVESIINAVTSKGFPSFRRSAEGGSDQSEKIRIDQQQDEMNEKRSLQFAWALAVTCYAHHLGHFLHALGLHEYAHTGFMSWLGTPLVGGAIGAAAILGPGRKLLADGFLSFIRGNPNMNSLISLGATTSFSAGLLSAFLPDLSIDPSFLEEPVMLLAFVLLGRSLERKARKEASSDLISLVNLLPSHGRLVKDELSADGKCDDLNYISIPSSMIRRGDVIQVLPGETIPVDGNILRGSCSVDESLLTGESRTVLKQPGDSVIGGTILFDSPILVKTTTTGDLSTLSRIGQLVSEAQGREAPVQRLADRVAGWFCYGVMSASAMTFGFWYNFGLQLFPNLIYSDVMADMNGSFALLSTKLAIDVLVVACPCALGLATPTAVLVSSSAAAKRGILVKGGQILERMADVTSIVLDKTGTITNGNMKVLSVSNFSDDGNDPVRLAATAETQTIHPIASALREYAANNGISLGKIANSTTIPGNGVVAKIDGDDIYVGRCEWVSESIGQHFSRSSPPQVTEIWVGSGTHGMVGKIELSDTLRTEAKPILSFLKGRGKHIYLLSGDDPSIAHNVGLLAGVEEANIFGGRRPEEKARFVEELKSNGHTVAMVGDGINDTIALGTADVGVAMGKGADAAGSAADVILLGDNLNQLKEAIMIGDNTMAKIRQNLGLALVYNILGIPIAAGILLPEYGIMLSPTFAGAMMACSSIVVVSNSLLLKNPSSR